MMTSSNGNIVRVTSSPLWGESTGHRWFLHKGQRRGVLMFSLICAWTNGWVNNWDTGDLRRHRVYYDVTVMTCTFNLCSEWKWHTLQIDTYFSSKQFISKSRDIAKNVVLFEPRPSSSSHRFDSELTLNTLKPRQNDRHFADDILKAFSWMKMY